GTGRSRAQRWRALYTNVPGDPGSMQLSYTPPALRPTPVQKERHRGGRLSANDATSAEQVSWPLPEAPPVLRQKQSSNGSRRARERAVSVLACLGRRARHPAGRSVPPPILWRTARDRDPPA